MLVMSVPLSDPKPIKQIKLKNLANAPECLQRMLLHLQNYDVLIKYWPGKEMQVADTFNMHHLMTQRYHLTLS